MVRILSGMAMPTKATTGTQIEIEQRDQHADALGAEPVEPAEREFALLLAGQPAARPAGSGASASS